MNKEEQEEKIKNRIKIHEAQIEACKIKLKEINSFKDYGTIKGTYLKTMKVLTSPFASYNKNLDSYLSNPSAHALQKLIVKANKATDKILCLSELPKNSKKIDKLLKKIKALDTSITENNAYLNSKYNKKEINVKDVMKKLDQVHKALSEEKQTIEKSFIDGGDPEEQAKALLQELKALKELVPSDS